MSSSINRPHRSPPTPFSPTQCSRCKGLLVKVYIDMVDASEFSNPGSAQFITRCINCGERLDETVLQNRQRLPIRVWKRQNRLVRPAPQSKSL